MRRLRLALLVLVFTAGCASGALKPGPNDGSTLDFESRATIVIDDNGIHPEVTKARVNEAIKVINEGTKDHGLTSDTIDAGTLHPGETTTVFLTATGTVELRDRADLSHKATIEVTDAAGS